MRSLLKMLFLQTDERKGYEREEHAAMLRGHILFFIRNVCFHASWPLTRRARPDRIPVVCFEIVGLFDHETPLVVIPLPALPNSLDSN